MKSKFVKIYDFYMLGFHKFPLLCGCCIFIFPSRLNGPNVVWFVVSDFCLGTRWKLYGFPMTLSEIHVSNLSAIKPKPLKAVYAEKTLRNRRRERRNWERRTCIPWYYNIFSGWKQPTNPFLVFSWLSTYLLGSDTYSNIVIKHLYI